MAFSGSKRHAKFPAARKAGWWTVLLTVGVASVAGAAQFRIAAYAPNELLAWTNSYPTGICCVLGANSPTGPWVAEINTFATNSKGQVALWGIVTRPFCRVATTDIQASNPNGFGNLAAMYGRLSTVAGSGAGGTDGTNYWRPSFEGGFATNAALSRPHLALTDATGNIFIVDKNSHSVLKVTLDGRIHTVAGTHAAGNGVDTAAPATSVALNFPNGLWLGGDGAVYILDTGNSKVRWFDTNGTMTTLFTDADGISGGRGLWVKDDRTLAYFASGNDVKRWSPGVKIKSVNTVNFSDPSNFVVKPDGNLVVTDDVANRVYLLNASSGSQTVLFGSGGTNQVTDGALATASSLYGVRAVWPLPTGGWFLGMQAGSQVAYVDPAGIIHIWLNGYEGWHAGDGQWFYAPGYKISEVRGVSLDNADNILIVENDNGYVRRIQFLPMTP